MCFRVAQSPVGIAVDFKLQATTHQLAGVWICKTEEYIYVNIKQCLCTIIEVAGVKGFEQSWYN